MRKPFALAALLSLFLVPAAHAAIPRFDAACGGMIEVHEEDGTVFINGKAAKVSQEDDKSYKATSGGTTVTIHVRPGAAPNVTYTARHGDAGDCNITR